ncbi:FAD-dependent oxidoreductase [Saccharothrix sp. NRRL B-16314]|uniref:FAD-dependent oxidoreductase n=1 Tax=Saccharothrix sp. NRRL B-16314 TaxID=1463825 RepID=UPI0022AF6459|nr:NAD(P)/FAD-dependent oxidoreductase [Saccharothrix sp. NRRL B-16314]
MAPLSAIIVGGGVSGLALSGMLTRQGADVTVLERAQRRRDGLAITLWPNALLALRHSGGEDVYEAVTKVCEPIGAARMFTSRGQVAGIDLGFLVDRFGLSGQGVTRAELLDALAGTAGVDIRYGCEVTGVDPRGTVTLAGGETLRADVVIGADGVGSAVRRALLPPGTGDGRENPLHSWQGVVDRGDWDSPGADFFFTGRGTYGVMPLTGNRAYWFVDGSPDAPPTGAGWPAVISALVDATPADRIFPGEAWDRRPARGWGQGRVTLLGDAAHPMLPTIGQGACMALEDAGVLAARLAAISDPAAALRSYEQDRYPRVHKTFKRARGMLRLRSMPTPVRDRVLASMPGRAMTHLFTAPTIPIPEFR